MYTSARLNTKVRRVVMAVVVLGLIVLAALVWHLGRILPATIASQKHSGFDKSRFFVLLFPTRDNNPYQRAVIVSLDECERDAIEVHENAGVITVGRDRFTAAPPQDHVPFVKRFNETLALWGAETDWRGAEWDLESSARETTATLLVEDKRGTLREYVYRIEDTAVHPMSLTTTVDMARNMAD